MNFLETRFYREEELIINEMDEAFELTFVETGKYKVGFEVNKKRFFKRQFGESTTIGGFEICYQKRFMFMYVAKTWMDCQAIRKSVFLNILNQYPEFK